MGKGHFAGLGCNGYFAAGHWGGDGAAASATIQRGGGAVWLERRHSGVPRKRLYERVKEYLEVKVRD